MCLIFNGYVTFKHNTIDEYEGVEKNWIAMQNYEHE